MRVYYEFGKILQQNLLEASPKYLSKWCRCWLIPKMWFWCLVTPSFLFFLTNYWITTQYYHVFWTNHKRLSSGNIIFLALISIITYYIIQELYNQECMYFLNLSSGPVYVHKYLFKYHFCPTTIPPSKSYFKPTKYKSYKVQMYKEFMCENL